MNPIRCPGVDRGTRLPRLESPQITVTAEQWKAGQVETIIQAAVDPNPRREKLLTLGAALRTAGSSREALT